MPNNQNKGLFFLLLAALGFPCSHAVLAQSIARDAESDQVGSSVGEFSVSQSGAAIYTMPLYAPPGTAGVAPQISISYSSQGGYGPLGQGFVLTGESAITRCRATVEAGDFVGSADIDGDGVGIQFDEIDRFCLDGQRLMLVGGQYGAPESTYRTEIDQFLLVTAKGGAVDDPQTVEDEYTGPQYFEVRRKDGSLSEYGNTADSRIERNGCVISGSACTQTAYAYAINRMTDSTGNYIAYAYQELGDSEYNLLTVSYTGKANLPGQSGPTLAPYARFRMIYSSAPLEERTLAYLRGSRMAQTQRLTAIVTEDQTGFSRMLRYYQLNYQTSISGSNLRQLQSVRECRDGTLAVCYPPTVFNWSPAINEYLTQESQNFALPPGISGELQIKDQRIGDIDGDSRPDLAYWRADSACPNGQMRLFVSFADRTLVSGEYWATLVAPSQGVICSKLSTTDGELSTGWALLDFNADGREDLALADDENVPGARWHIYPSIGRPGAGQQVFNTTSDLLTTTINSSSDAFNQAQFGDFNGDGLADLLTGDLILYFSERNAAGTGLQFGTPYPIAFTFLPNDPCANPEASDIVCVLSLGNEFTGRGLNTASDLSGDGRADIQVRIFRQPASRAHPWQGRGRIVVAPQSEVEQHRVNEPNGGSGAIYWYLMAMDRTLGPSATTDCGGNANPDPETQCTRQIQDATVANGDSFYADTRRFADVNGDGLPDIIEPTGNAREFRVTLNTGSPIVNAAPIVVADVDSRLQVLDIDGNGRADLVYPQQNAGKSEYLKRSWRATGGSGSFDFATPVPGNGIDPCDVANCALADLNDLFIDLDADGTLDYLRYRNRLGSASLMISRAEAANRYRPRDQIERIINGYGAVTDIRYQPLTNRDVYRRDSGSILDADQNATNGLTRFGRGSPVIDVLAPMYVVARITSSSPLRDNAGATSSIHYRYAGAKMQAGGRGFLGFRELTTIDGNGSDSTGYVIGITRYQQDFPYIGSPAVTEKRVTTGVFTETPCRVSMEAIGQSCFPHPGLQFPAESSPWTQVAASYYESVPAFTPTLPAQPIHARLFFSDEGTFDFNGGGAMTTRVLNAFFYASDGSGDVLTTATETRQSPFELATIPNPGEVADRTRYGKEVLEQVFGLTTCTFPCVRLEVTENDYFPNDFLNWRLGRLETSTVTIRDAEGGVRSRFSDFTYDLASAAKTGLLTSERVQKLVDSRDDLRTLYTLDAFGNRTAAYTCSNDLNDTVCQNRLQVVMRPVNSNGTPSERVHRYVRTSFDSIGRYAIATHQPYYNGAIGNGVTDQPTMQVISRDEHGQITSQVDVNGRTSGATTGWLGRSLQTWTQTGDTLASYAETVTRFRWCLGTPQAGTKVPCPAGAIFRSKTMSTGAPATYAYFDVLGREVLKVSESFNQGILAKDFHATCTGYDRHARVPFVSEPFFLTSAAVNGEPDFLSGTYAPCALSGLTGTRTFLDPIGRVVKVRAPEYSAGNPIETITNYLGLTTVTTNTYIRDTNGDGIGETRQETRTETKDAAGQVIMTIDTANIATRYRYNTDGQLTHVCRNALSAQSLTTPCPDASSTQIVTTIGYDMLGRKISETDPDLGTATVAYNAAGEVIRSVDGGGNQIENHYDAQGRVWKRVSNKPVAALCPNGALFCDGFEGLQLNPSTAVVDLFEFDTDINGLGMPAFIERQEVGQPIYRKTMDYDSIGRATSVQTELDGETYLESTTYDAIGRIETQTDASGSALTQHYTARGYPERQTYNLANVELVRTLETDARGRVIRERRAGNASMEVARQYDALTGQLQRICAGLSCAIQEWDYAWDALDTLVSRERYRTTNSAKNHREVFLYDDLHRLTQSRLTKVGGIVPGGGFVTAFSAIYDALGNLCTKNGNAYRYGPRSGCANNFTSGSPHTVRQALGRTMYYDDNGDLAFSDSATTDRFFTYDAQRLATAIEQVGSSAHTSRFHYGPGQERYKRTDTNGSGTTTTRYIGSIEKITLPSGIVEIKRYVAGVAIFTTRSNAPGVTEQRFTFGDHLNSVETITDQNGSIIETVNFDPHGTRRDIVDWQGLGTAAATTTRGFTGHEHIDGVGLIHMNARIFDPELGRFLQADVVVEAPSNLQSWNRFTYVFNNPLSLTDPTGRMSDKDWQGVVAFAAVLVTGGIAALPGMSQAAIYATVTAGGFLSATIATSSWRAGVWGAFSAFAFHGIGETFAKGTMTGKVTAGKILALKAAKVLAHGMIGGAFNAMSGGKMGHGFLSAAVTQALGGYIERIDANNAGFSASRTAVAALVGGTVSHFSGGKFANGAMTAAFSRAFNDEVSGGGGGGASRRKYRMTRTEKQMRDVALSSIDTHNPASIESGLEAAGIIYRTTDGTIESTPAVWSEDSSLTVDVFKALRYVPDGAAILGDWHTHGSMSVDGQFGDFTFSSEDIEGTNQTPHLLAKRGVDGSNFRGSFVGTPSNSVKYYRLGTSLSGDWDIDLRNPAVVMPIRMRNDL